MAIKSVGWRWLSLAVVGFPCITHAAGVNDFRDFSLHAAGAVVLPGRLYVPTAALTDSAAPRPLIVFLHGGGENGSDNLSQINANIDNLLAEAKRRGAFLYAPQTGANWNARAITDYVMIMVDRAVAEQRVDAARLYVTGISNGGGGTWNILSRYGDRFAAGAPICGVAPASGFLTATLTGQAVWAFHGRDDHVVPHSVSRSVINDILAAGSQSLPTYPSPGDLFDFTYSSPALNLRYTEFGDSGHAIWPRVYNTVGMYDWLFAHTTEVPEPSTVCTATGGICILVSILGRRSRGKSYPAIQSLRRGTSTQTKACG